MSSEVETSLEISGSRRIQRFLDSARNDKAQQATRALFADLTIYHDDATHSAAMNMAIDEALLETAAVPLFVFIAGVPLPCRSDILGSFPMWRFTRRSAI